jgi:hypothetical protein
LVGDFFDEIFHPKIRAAGVKFRRDDIVTGPGGSQIWLLDPSGNLVELFQPAQ